MNKNNYGEDDLDTENFSEVYPTYNTVDVDHFERDVFIDNDIPHGEISIQEETNKDEHLTDEEINIKPTPLYTSFEQIKKELVVLDLERQIAWEELVSLKHEFKEDIAPSNFVEPAIKVVGAVGGFVLLKNLIFGR